MECLIATHTDGVNSIIVFHYVLDDIVSDVTSGIGGGLQGREVGGLCETVRC